MKRIGLVGATVALLMFGSVGGASAQPQGDPHNDEHRHGNKKEQDRAAEAAAQQAAAQQQTRVDQQEQQRRLTEQQQRNAAYQAHLDQQVAAARTENARLEANRRSQAVIQQQYVARLEEQRRQTQADRHYDTNRDAYYNSPWTFSYSVGGRARHTNQYGKDLLEKAVSNGYQEGFLAGDADRHDHWRYNYQASFAYRDANYGYTGRYVDRDDYNDYFRQGFSKGYDDGYYRRSRYGRRSNGNFTVLDVTLSKILSFQLIH